MILTLLPDAEKASLEKQRVLSDLQLLVISEFEDPETLEVVTTDEIAKGNSEAILALNTNLNARVSIDTIKGGPHAHGNLEAILNIIVGLLLGLLTLPSIYKQILSWIFIVGTIMHAGMAFLGVLGFSWAGMLLGTGIGPVLILLGLLLMGVAIFVGYKKN